MDVDTVALYEEINGTIEYIRVKNFFCHDNFEVKFNPHINFIVGRNGSGKSAILTALVVAFGSRASVTNRGTSLTSFIKKGANSATIEIKIKNNATNAYKRDLYGDSITIVRHILASGSSSYKVKSASGKIISSSIQEVKALELQHEIQVNNPISILNQDEARNFYSSDPKRIYNLFKRATNMDITEENYHKAKEYCNEAAKTWQLKNEACLSSEKEYLHWQKLYEQMKSHTDLVEKLRKVENEFYWCLILDGEKERKMLEEEIQTIKDQAKEIAEKIESFANPSNDQKIMNLKAQIQSDTEQKVKVENELQHVESMVRVARSALTKLELEHNNELEKCRSEKTSQLVLEKEMNLFKKGDLTMNRKLLAEKVDSSKIALDEVTARFNTAKQDMLQSHKNVEHAKGECEAAKKKVSNHKLELQKMRTKVTTLRSAGEEYALYGGNMANLMKKVKEAITDKKFSMPPKGPIGTYLKVKEAAWASPLEYIIGGLITSFIVNNLNDLNVLTKLMNDVYGDRLKPSITICSFGKPRYDISRFKVVCDRYKSSLDYLDCPETDVANFLIDRRKLESILVVPEQEDAMSVCRDAGSVPKNCIKVVTQDCTEFHPAPNYRCYGGAGKHARFLQVSRGDRLSQLEAEMKEKERILPTLVAQETEANRKLNAASASERHITDVHHRLYDQLHKAIDIHNKLTHDLEEISQKQMGSLGDDMNEIIARIHAHNSRAERLKRSIDEAKTNVGSLEAKQQQLRTKRALYINSINTSNVTLSNEDCSYQQLKHEMEVLTQKQNRLKAKEKDLQKELQDKITEHEEKLKTTSNLGSRLEKTREKSVIEQEIRNIRVKINAVRMTNLSKKELATKYLNAKKAYKETKQELDDAKELIEHGENIVKEHLGVIQQIQQLMTINVNVSFGNILTMRNYAGNLTFSGETGTLSMNCWRGGSQQNTSQALSGGERSFSTMAFLVALWENVQMPFVFLDEFDVFMDDMNRKVALECLVNYALQHPNRQFVFLTPQDSSSYQASEKISIHKMPDPRN